MADQSKIEWTEITWNFITGCTKISDGCINCYIERTPPFRMGHRRFDRPGIGGATGVKLHSNRLHWPLTKWRKPARIFVNSLADIFHEDVPDQFIADAFAVMSLAKQHTFQVLTKRHARMRSLLAGARTNGFWDAMAAALFARGFSGGIEWPLPNVWVGVSVENQQWADIRVPALLDTPAAVRWLSMEPLLGPVRLSAAWVDMPADARPVTAHDLLGIGLPNRVDWVVAGGESGPGARPAHPDWFRSLRDQCVAAGVPYFFKQWGEYGTLPKVVPDGRYADSPRVTVANDGTIYQPGDLAWPDGPRTGEAIRSRHDRASLHAMYRVGKKAAGRELDGRTWDEYPQAVIVGA